ncbi:hypothetical protein, partial [Fructobacillus ficulneus]
GQPGRGFTFYGSATFATKLMQESKLSYLARLKAVALEKVGSSIVTPPFPAPNFSASKQYYGLKE